MLSIAYDETGESTRIVRTAIFIIVVFLGGLVVWAVWAPISGAVVAPGVIKIDTKRKTIQQLNSGVVKEILVHEGQNVKKGQLLLVLDDIEVNANLNILRGQLNALLARESRLQAEQRFADKVDFPSELQESSDPKVKALLSNEDALFQTKKKSIDDQIALTQKELALANQEEDEYKANINLTEESIRLKEQRVKMGEALQAKQFVDKNTFMGLQEALADARAGLSQIKARRANISQGRAELEVRIISLRTDYIKMAEDELKQIKPAIFELQQKIQPAELAVSRSRVLAPIDGQVIDLKVTTIGGVVKAGEPLMDLVPEEQDLLMEVKVQTQDIEAVHINQTADIQLLAYNSRSVPHVVGTVVYVSGDALQEGDATFFRAHIRVYTSALENLPEISLTPGMPVNAFIQTRPKTFFDVLFRRWEESVSRGLRQET